MDTGHGIRQGRRVRGRWGCLEWMAGMVLVAACSRPGEVDRAGPMRRAAIQTSGCPAGYHVITGTEGDDHLVGTNQADCLEGLGGNDILEGGNGDDLLLGGEGDDRLVGGNGCDQLEGGAGHDVLLGENGEDTLLGGEGDDVLTGGNGPDQIQGGAGHDLIAGDHGPDNLAGEAGNDVLLSGGGSGVIAGGDGADAGDHASCETLVTALPECSAGVGCPTGQVCVPDLGWCVRCRHDSDCDDGNACTADACQPVLGCRHDPVPDGSACQDGEACTLDACRAGTCVGVPLDCDDQNACSDDSCHAGQCQHVGNGTCQGPDRFVETDGLVAMEAENFATRVAQGGYAWDRVSDSTFSGGVGMKALPLLPYKTIDLAVVGADSPRLDFSVTFASAGAYRVWIRGLADTGDHDSCYVGLDGVPSATTSQVSWRNAYNQYLWRGDYSGIASAVVVPTPGAHTLNVWMREPGLVIDKIVVQPSANTASPTELGPAETIGPTCAGVGNTFPGNPEICDGLDNDCNGTADFPGEIVDRDGDGVRQCADCDDTDAQVYPGHPEICDGHDNDCDGLAGFPDETIDDDADGAPFCADCDDTHPHVRPGHPEICDGRDNDCNGLADADPAGEVDGDGDGILSCYDCDDARADADKEVRVSFLVHGPTGPLAAQPDQLHLAGNYPLPNLSLSRTEAPGLWRASVSLPRKLVASYRYSRAGTPATAEVGPWGEAIPPRRLQIGCGDLAIEDAIWNWDDLTTDTQGGPLPAVETDKGPTLSTFGNSGTQATITVHLPTVSDAILHYGTESGVYPNVMTKTGGKSYEFSLTGLQPGTTYYYSVESGGEVASEYRFTTSAEYDKPFRFVAFGDSQDDDGDLPLSARHIAHREIVAQAFAYHPEVVIRTGDLVSVSTDLNQWAYFFAIERPLLSSALYLPVQGNHDTAGSNFVNFFALPPTPSTSPERYYAVRYNQTLFIGLSTEIGTATITGAEKTWLTATLDAANQPGSGIVWKVAYFHRPLFSSGQHGGDWSAPISANWHPLFRDKGVDVVFSGHDHDYERLQADGVQYLIIGGGGSDLRGFKTPVAGSLVREAVHHLVSVDVDGASLTADVRRIDGSRLDGFTLTPRTQP